MLTSLNAQKASDPELLRLGNGIAAIAEGQIITVEELRRELEPIIHPLQKLWLSHPCPDLS